MNMLSNSVSVLSRFRSSCVNPAPGFTIVGTDSSKPEDVVSRMSVRYRQITYTLVQSSRNQLSRALASCCAAREHRLVDSEHIRIPCLCDCTTAKVRYRGVFWGRDKDIALTPEHGSFPSQRIREERLMTTHQQAISHQYRMASYTP